MALVEAGMSQDMPVAAEAGNNPRIRADHTPGHNSCKPRSLGGPEGEAMAVASQMSGTWQIAGSAARLQVFRSLMLGLVLLERLAGSCPLLRALVCQMAVHLAART